MSPHSSSRASLSGIYCSPTASRMRSTAPSSRAITSPRLGDRRNGGAGRHRARAPRGPFGHQAPALLVQIRASVSLLDFGADRMREAELSDMGGIGGTLATPIAERTAEAVHCHAGV